MSLTFQETSLARVRKIIQKALTCGNLLKVAAPVD